MRILMKRIAQHKGATISNLSVDRLEQPLFTLEDRAQQRKIYGQTRINSGIYNVQPYEAGRLYAHYKAKFDWHGPMLQIMHVPDFTGVCFHIGNWIKDTEGCPLIGLQASWGPGEPAVLHSTQGYKLFYEHCLPAARAGALVLQIINEV